MMEEDLDSWRRTHYTSEITPELDDKEVILMGWVASIRDHGNIIFVMLADKDDEIQLTIKKDSNLFEIFKEIKEHSCIGVKGVVKSRKNAPRGVEIIPIELKIFALAKKIPPFSVYSKTVPNTDIRLDLRAVDLRRRILRSVFKIRYNILKAVREYLDKNNFIEVNTPKMIASATEGGAALFPIFYFNKEAFLAQSPQLYKEQLTMAFDNVFEIGPIFRAEPSRTTRHLAEATSIDIEKSFADYNDVMNILEELIVYVIDYINNHNSKELEELDVKLIKPELPFPRYTYDQLINMLKDNGAKIEWGDDLNTENLKLLGKLINGYYFITDWPTSAKPFYAKPKRNDPKISETFDLMYNELELSSGSTRINRKNELVERMKMQGLNPDAFEYHLKVFDYGMPPHAGFGLGLERFLMIIANLDNIRDATFYPRDIERLSP
ncbi:MAG: aspartate--tRNA(Asn) ligase [Candidatus Nitrosocaldaceae archaeon]|nr:MAG: aspartate--tRNA(Asn) ligase [Candidatus Nitrosocaldaceae archaeon]